MLTNSGNSTSICRNVVPVGVGVSTIISVSTSERTVSELVPAGASLCGEEHIVGICVGMVWYAIRLSFSLLVPSKVEAGV